MQYALLFWVICLGGAYFGTLAVDTYISKEIRKDERFLEIIDGMNDYRSVLQLAHLRWSDQLACEAQYLAQNQGCSFPDKITEKKCDGIELDVKGVILCGFFAQADVFEEMRVWHHDIIRHGKVVGIAKFDNTFVIITGKEKDNVL